MIDGIDSGGSRVAFIVFGAPVNEFSHLHVGAFLFCGEVASKVSLIPISEACTLHPSLGSGILDSGNVSSL